MRTRTLLFTGLVVACLLVVQSTTAQLPELSGVSDFLCGFWKSKKGEMTYIILHNPTAVTRDAVVLYYDDDQKFVNCQVVRLTPHDFERLPLLCPKGPYDASKSGIVLQGEGVAEIRSAPVVKENPNDRGGLIGYVQTVDGESIYEFGAATPPPSYSARGLTLGIAPLFPVDIHLFTPYSPIPNQYDAIRECVCEKLGTLKSPQELKNIFCLQVK